MRPNKRYITGDKCRGGSVKNNREGKYNTHAKITVKIRIR